MSENQEYNENISPVTNYYTENLPRFLKNFTINAKKRIITKIDHKSHTPESCVKLRKIGILNKTPGIMCKMRENLGEKHEKHEKVKKPDFPQ